MIKTRKTRWAVIAAACLCFSCGDDEDSGGSDDPGLGTIDETPVAGTVNGKSWTLAEIAASETVSVSVDAKSRARSFAGGPSSHE